MCLGGWGLYCPHHKFFPGNGIYFLFSIIDIKEIKKINKYCCFGEEATLKKKQVKNFSVFI